MGLAFSGVGKGSGICDSFLSSNFSLYQVRDSCEEVHTYSFMTEDIEEHRYFVNHPKFPQLYFDFPYVIKWFS